MKGRKGEWETRRLNGITGSGQLLPTADCQSFGNGSAMRAGPAGWAFGTLEEIKPGYSFDETCQRTLAEAFSCFLESSGFEDAIRKAIWLGGDSDTLACITGGIAEAYYREIKADWIEKANELLPKEFGEVVARFKAAFIK